MTQNSWRNDVCFFPHYTQHVHYHHHTSVHTEKWESAVWQVANFICCKQHIWCEFPNKCYRKESFRMVVLFNPFPFVCSINLFGECWTSLFHSLVRSFSFQLVAIVYACELSAHFILRVGFYVSISVCLKLSFRKILFYVFMKLMLKKKMLLLFCYWFSPFSLPILNSCKNWHFLLFLLKIYKTQKLLDKDDHHRSNPHILYLYSF